MNKGILTGLIITFFIWGTVDTGWAATITKPYTFSDGTPAVADQVNANFDRVYDKVNEIFSVITVDHIFGRVGIGNTSPPYTLTVNGDAQFSTALIGTETLWMLGDAKLQVGNRINILGEIDPNIFIGTGENQYIQMQFNSAGDYAQLLTPSTYDIALMPGGNVGIGTTTPAQKLSVVGIIESTTGGIKFPDGTIQITAPGNVSWDDITDIPADFADNIDDVGLTSETDPQVGNNTTDYVPRWNGSSLVAGSIYDNGSSIGIGTASPNEQLEITGNFRLPQTTSTTGIIMSGGSLFIHTYGTGNFFAGINSANLTMSGYYNTGVGSNVFNANNTGHDNTATGFSALQSNYGGNYNTAIGSNALHSNSNGNNNTATGSNALRSNISGAGNTAFGSLALYSNISGSMNAANGDGALYYNTIGSNNIAIGAASLNNNTTASNNTAVGVSALLTQSYSNEDTEWDSNNTAIGYYALGDNQPTTTDNGKNNTAVGANSLKANTIGNNNTANGSFSLQNNETGHNNTATGYTALSSNTEGFHNTAVGSSALWSNAVGDYNTGIGTLALFSSTGDYNTAVGGSALSSNLSGSYNTAIGYNADVSSSSFTNATAIGYGASVDASNKVVIGNASVTSIGGYADWSNISDERVKEDIQDINYGLDFIRRLHPVSFKMKNGNDNTSFGFVAQDIEELLGDSYNILDVGGGKERLLSMRYTQLIAPMIKAMQQQQEMIDSQKLQIDAQKQQIADLQKIVKELQTRL